MSPRGNELREMFHSCVPDLFLARMLLLLQQSYPKANMHCISDIGLEPPERDNTVWAVRRGLIEGGMRKIAQGIPGMQAEVKLGREGVAPNPWNHTLIQAKRVLITQCSVKHPDEIVRPSISREMYAKSNKAKWLFPEMEPAIVMTDALLYSILIHGRDIQAPGELGFAYVRFPMPGVEQWYDEKIDVRAFKATGLAPDEHIKRPDDPEIKEEKDEA